MGRTARSRRQKYLPAFVAPEAYGKKKNPAYANIRQEVEEEIAKQAEEYKEKLAARRRKKKGNEQQEEILTDDGDSWELFFLIALGVFVAFAEALDLDVLIAALLTPFVKGMQYLSVEFDNISLDPTYWTTLIGNAYNELCRSNPAGFVITCLTVFVIGVVYILFMADIDKWWRERGIRAQGYDEQKDADGDGKVDAADDERLADEKLEKLFKDIDVDGSGEILRDEMEPVIKRMFGDDIDASVIDEIMKAGDTDNDGDIDLEEFKVIMKAVPCLAGRPRR